MRAPPSSTETDIVVGALEERRKRRLFFFFKFIFYPGWHPCGQAGWLSTTQVLKGSLLLESGKNEKEKQRKSFVTTSLGMN